MLPTLKMSRECSRHTAGWLNKWEHSVLLIIKHVLLISATKLSEKLSEVLSKMFSASAMIGNHKFQTLIIDSINKWSRKTVVKLTMILVFSLFGPSCRAQMEYVDRHDVITAVHYHHNLNKENKLSPDLVCLLDPPDRKRRGPYRYNPRAHTGQ